MANLGGTASVEIDAPIEKVWAVVEDVLSGARLAGRARRDDSARAGRAAAPTLVETENDIKVRRIKAQVRFRYEGPSD